MKFQAFEAAARAAFEGIPSEYREGVDGLVVSRETLAHPTLPEVYTLGQCLTEDHLSDYSGPDTTRSLIALYWGSFRALGALDPEFDWEEELWETLTHELRHHLESLAGDDALEGVDYAADQSFNRNEGLDFDPWYYQYGEDIGGSVYRVEASYYLEQVWRAADFDRADSIEFDWYGQRFRMRRPDKLGDVHFVWPRGIDTGTETLELVLVRRRSWWEDAKRLVGTSRPLVYESEARVAKVGHAP
jgi:hypothetical protein